MKRQKFAYASNKESRLQWLFMSPRPLCFIVSVDPLRRDEFEAEACCLTQAAAHGIPSPHLVARGHLREIPYLIQTFGRQGSCHVAPEPASGTGVTAGMWLLESTENGRHTDAQRPARAREIHGSRSA